MNQIYHIENAINLKPQAPEALHRYFKLCLSYIDYISPATLHLETGRVMQLLCQHPMGLAREELLHLFYEDYAMSSFNKQESLKVRLEKIIQRSRTHFQKYNMTIYYCKLSRKYSLKLV